MIKVLYVDDNVPLLELTKEYMEGNGGMRVDICPSALEAMRSLDLLDYDTIVSDYQMPGMTGIEFLRSIRGSGNEVPFILFTGKGREDVAINALNNGADFYLQKGGDPNSQYRELGNMISHIVGKRAAYMTVHENEAMMSAILRTSRDIILVLDHEGRMVYVNESVERVLGFQVDMLVGTELREFLCPTDRPALDMLMMQYDMGCNESGEVDLRFIGKDSEVILSCLATAMTESGMGRKVVVNARDITERVRAVERESDLNRIFESLSEGVDNCIVIIQNGTVVHCNGRTRELVDKRSEDIIGRPFTDFIDPEDVPRAVDRYMRRIKGEDPLKGFHVRIMAARGARRSFSVHGNLIRHDGRSADMLVLKDEEW